MLNELVDLSSRALIHWQSWLRIITMPGARFAAYWVEAKFQLPARFTFPNLPFQLDLLQ